MSNSLPGYSFIDRIGIGNFSEVWKAIDQNFNFVAVKILDDKQIRAQPKVLELLQSEIYILKTINNKNVVKLYEHIVQKGKHFLVLEYCNQGDLEKYVKGKPDKVINEGEAIGFFKQLLNGFKALHEIKAMHRDFKLANVLMNDGVLKIADLGFSKVADLAKTALGTGVYMAPEIIKYQKYNNKVDVWSLGVSLYEMLFGDFPFFGKNEVVLLKSIEENKINFNLKGRTISKSMENLIRSMLVPDPKKRIEWIDIYNHELLNEQPPLKDAGLLNSISVYLKKGDMEKQHQNMIFLKNKGFYQEKGNLEYDNTVPLDQSKDKKIAQQKNKKVEYSSSEEEQETLPMNNNYSKKANAKNEENQINKNKKNEKGKKLVLSSSEEEEEGTRNMQNLKKKNPEDAPKKNDKQKEIKQYPSFDKLEAEKMNQLKKDAISFLESKYLHWRNIISQHAKVLGDGFRLINSDNSIYIYFIFAKRILFLSKDFSTVLKSKKNYFNQDKFFEDFINSEQYEKIASVFAEEKLIYEAYFESLLIDIQSYQTGANPLYMKLKGEFNKDINNVEELFKEILIDHMFNGQIIVNSLKDEKKVKLAEEHSIHLINLFDCFKFRDVFKFDAKQEAGFNFDNYDKNLKNMKLDELLKKLEEKIVLLF